MSTGYPSSVSWSRPFNSDQLPSADLANPIPGSMMIFPLSTPCSLAYVARWLRKSTTRWTNCGPWSAPWLAPAAPWESASPKRSVSQCMRHRYAPVSAATWIMSGSASPPDTSLMSVAPAWTACRATVARMVSTESMTLSFARASTTGITRWSSVCSVTRTAPGRVDSPPMSMMVAPSQIMSRAWVTAMSGRVRSVGSHWPPSEKESSVMLRTPITCVRGASMTFVWLLPPVVVRVLRR